MMTKQKIVEVRDDLNRLIDALNPGSPRAAVARAVEKLDAILDALPAGPPAPRYYEMCGLCGVGHDEATPHRSYLKCGFCGKGQENPMPTIRSCCEAGKAFDVERAAKNLAAL